MPVGGDAAARCAGLHDSPPPQRRHPLPALCLRLSSHLSSQPGQARVLFVFACVCKVYTRWQMPPTHHTLHVSLHIEYPQHLKVGLQMMQIRTYAASSTRAVIMIAMRAFCHHMCRRSTRACTGRGGGGAIGGDGGATHCTAQQKVGQLWDSFEHPHACIAHLPLEGECLLPQ